MCSSTRTLASQPSVDRSIVPPRKITLVCVCVDVNVNTLSRHRISSLRRRSRRLYFVLRRRRAEWCLSYKGAELPTCEMTVILAVTADSLTVSLLFYSKNMRQRWRHVVSDLACCLLHAYLSHAALLKALDPPSTVGDTSSTTANRKPPSVGATKIGSTAVDGEGGVDDVKDETARALVLPERCVPCLLTSPLVNGRDAAGLTSRVLDKAISCQYSKELGV